MADLDPLAPLSAWCSGLIANLEPASRRQLARVLAQRLREANAKRIAAQINPDGTAFEPRKPSMRQKQGGLRRRAMFSKLRTARYLKVGASPEGALVEFAAEVQRIAQVHHFGLKDRVNKRRGPEVAYPARELLGINDGDIASLEELILPWLTP